MARHDGDQVSPNVIHTDRDLATPGDVADHLRTIDRHDVDLLESGGLWPLSPSVAMGAAAREVENGPSRVHHHHESVLKLERRRRADAIRQPSDIAARGDPLTDAREVLRDRAHVILQLTGRVLCDVVDDGVDLGPELSQLFVLDTVRDHTSQSGRQREHDGHQQDGE